MNKMQEQVAEFHRAFKVPIHSEPVVAIAPERVHLRAKLIFEEVKETCDAMNCAISADLMGDLTIETPRLNTYSLAEVTDGLMDSLYVIFGACLEFGIDAQKAYDEIHRSNMSKLWTVKEWGNAIIDGRDIADSLSCDVIDHLHEDDESKCLVVKRADGKIIKSPSYSPADLNSVLFGGK